MALAGAAIGWWAPAVSLAIPAFFVLNAVFVHMMPSARDERLTQGTISAVVIYLPVSGLDVLGGGHRRSASSFGHRCCSPS